MSKPIPDEIMREAGKALVSPGFGRDILQISVARALMARDERAAGICRTYPDSVIGKAFADLILTYGESNG